MVRASTCLKVHSLVLGLCQCLLDKYIKYIWISQRLTLEIFEMQICIFNIGVYVKAP